MQDIFDFAMQMEKDGEVYYREIAEKCGNKGLATILNMMADEEVKHYNIFKRMKAGKADYTASSIVESAQNIFQKMKDEGDTFDFDASHEDYYKKAMEVEKKSEEFYLSKIDAAESEDHKNALKKIADEEHRHYKLLENIVDFIQSPERWLEDAEWGHLSE